MARVKTLYASNFADGEIADDTEIRFRLFSDDFTNTQADVWAAFDSNNAQWRIDNPGQADPRHCVVAVPANPTNPEKTFVEVRFKVANDVDGEILSENSQWAQYSTTNYPDQSAGFLGDLKETYDAERVLKSLVPV